MQWLPSAPNERVRGRWLAALPYAHRGLHAPHVPENSRAAFEAAIGSGMGIELDVRACRTGDAIVFHDQDLRRMCGTSEMVDTLDPAALAAARLAGTDQNIATLDQILELIAGRAPLLVEIKMPLLARAGLCRSVARSLERYSGDAAVMSFSLPAMIWFRRCAPHIVRGLVVSERRRRKNIIEQHFALASARPDFLAFDVRSLPSPFAARARRRGLAILAWTVRDPPGEAIASRHADQIIHELPAR